MRGIELTPEHPIREVVEHARTAERAGFDTVLTTSHYFNRDPFVVADRIARATDEVRVGPAAANPYDTHPVALASRMATLQETSDGRAVFGIGPGDKSTLSGLGVDRDRPLRRVLESFRVARQLWAGERVSHDGTFTAVDVGLEYEVDGSIPVYVAAQGPHMIRMSAKHADGVLYNASHPADYEWAADRVREGLDERPESRGAFEFVGYVSLSVAEDGATARKAARPPVAFIASGAAPPVLDRHGIDHERAGQVGKLLSAGEYREAFDAVSESMLSAFAVAGTPEEVTDRLATIRSVADGLVVGTPLGPDLETAVELAGEAVDAATG